MAFDKQNIKTNYSTDKDNVLSEFYIPVLSEATSYDRAVGYFTTSGLLTFLRGIGGLVENNGKMRLVIGDSLTGDEYTAIKNSKNQELALSRLDKKWSEFIEQDLSELKKHRLEIFSWLFNKGFLEIKYAFRRKGLFHKKIGVITDADGQTIVFAGSNNETESALISNKDNPDGNSEEFDVYVSWKSESFEDHGRDKIESFNRVWNNKETNTLTVDLPSEHYEKIKNIYTEGNAPKSDIESRQAELFDHILQSKDMYAIHNEIAIPANITLRDYQKEVINGWFNSNGQGIIQMATGTGKTVTAISAAVHIFNQSGLKMLLVICPYKHLAKQWVGELKKFGFNPVSAYISAQKWHKKLTDILHHPPKDGCISVVTTSSTFIGDKFQGLIDLFPDRTVIIGDEVHNYGSEEMIKKLPNSINLRMGLSATPERHMDAEGTKAIFDYFGKSVEPIVTLSDALDWEVLTKYYYHPIQTTLNDDEYDEYEQITGKISKLVAMGHSIDDNSSSSLNYLLIQRARIISSCENKIPKLKKLIKSLMSKEKPDKFLVYCGDGKVDSSTTDDEVKQIEEVTRLLGKELGLIVSRYTAETKLDDREKMQLDIASGEIDGIVAIRCLDEGVDIPEVDTAFILASSSNPKQFIQRRGRVLRRAPDKEYATIYDFIVTPPEYSEVTEMDRKLLEKELNRCIEFADMSENKFSARGSLIDIMKKYDLLYM